MSDTEKITALKSFLPNTTMYQASGVTLESLISSFISFRDNSANRWNDTQSPVDTMNPMRHTRNYARGSDYDKYDTWFNGTLLGGAFELESMPGIVGGIEIHPYVPGLSNEIGGSETDGNTYIQQFTAGADCIGFVQSSLSYSGVFYQAMVSESRKVTPSYWDTVGTRFAIDGSAMADLGSLQSALIVKRDDSDEIKVIALSYIVPGDVFYYQNGIGKHIAMIGSIDDNVLLSTQISVKLLGIRILESTHNQILQVFGTGKTSTLDDYSNDVDRQWQIRRAK